VAVLGTGLLGFVFNIMLVYASGPIENLPGPTGLAVATILYENLGKGGMLAIWAFVCLTASFVVITALQANSRSFYAFSRDGGLPDRGFFGRLSRNKISVNAVWLVVFLCIALVMLDFASDVAVNAVFSLCAIALDSSYIIPIICKVIFRDHPDVQFKPGPFDLGRRRGLVINAIAIVWTCFVVIILALPQVRPVTALNMNYASAILVLVLGVSGLWYLLHARTYYTGPRNFTQPAEAGEGGDVALDKSKANV